MEKSKNQLLECLLKMGCALADLLIQNKAQEGSSSDGNYSMVKLDEIMTDVMRLTDANDSKVGTVDLLLLMMTTTMAVVLMVMIGGVDNEVE